MTRNVPPDTPNAAIFAEASEWLVEFRAGDVDAEGERCFIAWLRRSPDHIQAYMEAAALWGDIPTLASDMKVDVDSVVSYARAQANVTPFTRSPADAEHLRSLGALDGPAEPTDVRSLRFPGGPAEAADVRSLRAPVPPSAFTEIGAHERRRKRLPSAATATAAAATAAATLAAVALLAGVLTFWHLTRGSHYTTNIGEQRTITLEDGSTLELGARSSVRVHFSQEQRDVNLLSGQALFSVAKDPSRPFTVSTENTRVRAIGTQFDVHRRSSGTTVTVFEGRVAVLPQPNSQTTVTQAPTAYLSAGEQVTVQNAPERTPHVRTIDSKAPVTLSARTLSFNDAPLADVIEEFNRYNQKQLVLTDRSLEALRISGVFSASKPASLLHFMGDQMHLEVKDAGERVEISPSR
jgi:transmembrane sensor